MALKLSPSLTTQFKEVSMQSNSNRVMWGLWCEALKVITTAADRFGGPA